MLSLLSVWRAKSSWETRETEGSNIVRTPNSPMFPCVCVCFSRSQRFHWGLDRQRASCHCPLKWFCRTSWAHNLCWGRTWPDSQTSRCSCGGAACPALSRTSKYDKNEWTSKSGMVSEVTVNEQQGWVRHEMEKARWRGMIHVQQTPFWQRREVEPCVCVTRMRSVRMWLCTRHVQKNVRATGECMYTSSSRRTHCSRSYMCTKPLKKTLSRKFCRKKINIHHSMTILTKKILQLVVSVRNSLQILRLHHSMSILIFLTCTCSISWLFINHCEWRLLGFTRHASLRDRPS